jgi:hypothetical protein
VVNVRYPKRGFKSFPFLLFLSLSLLLPYDVLINPRFHAVLASLLSLLLSLSRVMVVWSIAIFHRESLAGFFLLHILRPVLRPPIRQFCTVQARSFETTGLDPVPNLRASLLERALVGRVIPKGTARSASRSICQSSGSSFGVVIAPCLGNACLVGVAVSLLLRCRLLGPRLWIVEEGADLSFGPWLGSCPGRKRLYLAAAAVYVVVVAAVEVGSASAGVGGAEAIGDARVVVGRRKPVPAAAEAVVAHPSALHLQGLHS